VGSGKSTSVAQILLTPVPRPVTAAGQDALLPEMALGPEDDTL